MNLWRITTSLALVLAAFSLLASVWLYTKTQDESRARRGQTCTITEREQAAEVQQLRNTYEYLLELEGVQLHDPLNRALLRQLPMVEARAEEDNAPKFCDEPGIGLPEPDEKVPDRPARLRRLTGDPAQDR